MTTPAQVNQTVRLDPLGSVGAASFQFVLASADTFSFNHGFASRPRHVGLFIVCVIAELGYAVGDKVQLGANASVSIGVNKLSCSVAAVTVPSVVNTGTNAATAITPANWNWFITLED